MTNSYSIKSTGSTGNSLYKNPNLIPAVTLALTLVFSNTLAYTSTSEAGSKHFIPIEEAKLNEKLIDSAKSSISFSAPSSTVLEKLLDRNLKSKKELQREVQSFKELMSCWDGDDAEPIAIGAINNANMFLVSYNGNLIFEAFPDPDGSVLLQSDFAEGRVILSFNDIGEVAYFIRKNNATHRGNGATHENINDLFSSLL